MLKPKKKITKKEIKRDPLLESLYSAQRFYVSNRKKILTVSGGIGAVLVVSLIIMSAGRSSRREAQDLFTRSLANYHAEDYAAAISELDILVAEFPGTPAGKEALYYLGQSLFAQGDREAARSSLEAYLKEGTNPFLVAGALSTLADLAEGEEDFAQAAEYFEQASSVSVSPFNQYQNKLNAASNWLKAEEYARARVLLENLNIGENQDPSLKARLEELRSSLKTVAAGLD